MKTYDEALDQINIRVNTESEIEAAVKALSDHVERKSDLIVEIGENPRTHALIMALMDQIEDRDVFKLGMSAFVNGLLIGMEMERQEARIEP